MDVFQPVGQIMCYLLILLLSMTFGTGVWANDTWSIFTNDNTIRDIALFNGDILCATDGGVLRWSPNGVLSTKYTVLDGLSDNWVNSIYISPDGRAWFITYDEGVSIFDGNRWSSITQEDGLPSNKIYTIGCDSDGMMWFGGEYKGLTGYDGDQLYFITEIDSVEVNSIKILKRDNNGILWAVSVVGQVFIKSGEAWKLASLTLQGENKLVNSLSFAPDNTIWFATLSSYIHSDISEVEYHGIEMYDGSIWRTYTIEDGLPDNNIRSIDISTDGVVWASTWKGISRFDGERWTTFTSDDGLPGDWVNTVAFTPDGKSLIGTESGLCMYDGERWKSILDENTIIGTVAFAVECDSDNTVWCATQRYDIASLRSGISLFDGKVWRYFTDEDVFDNKSSFFITMLAAGKNNTMWATTGDCLSYFNGTNWSSYDSWAWNTPGHNIKSIAVTEDGTLWAGDFTYGVLKFHNGDWIVYDTDDGVVDNSINTIAVGPDGAIWTGSWRGGLSVFDGESWRIYTEADGLVSNVIQDITISDKNVAWIATVHGISRFDGNKWESFADKDGFGWLPSALIEVDSIGRVWLGTRDGLYMYDGATWTNLTHNSVSDITVDKMGIVWIATSQGLFCYNSDKGVLVDSGVVYSITIPTINVYPNPFNPATTISFTLPEAGFARLAVYNISGQLVRELVSENLTPGQHEIVWDGRNSNGAQVSSGVYIARLAARGRTAVRKITLVR